MRGAQAYLQQATQMLCSYLLNDNSRLQGPWFESLDWLLDVWTPEAARLGLHYVAHIVQVNTHHDIFSGRSLQGLPFELQVFQDSSAALNWLRRIRDLSRP
jgi:hypothetical protein